MYSLILFCSVPFVMDLSEVIVEIVKTNTTDYLTVSELDNISNISAFKLLEN